jgi:hypothetical protein
MTGPIRRLTILDLCVLVACFAVGLWLAADQLREAGPMEEEGWVALVVYLLGGLSLAGPPLLLRNRFVARGRLRIGEMFWFCQGTASWLLWPPIIVHRVRDEHRVGAMAPICYLYGTPLMALYVTTALIAGGWLRPRRFRLRSRRRAGRSWADAFGLILGLIWACTGLYILALIYRRDLLH